MRVGFIGLGDQGGPMAQMIAAAGFPMTVWARRPAVAAPFVARGARLAGDPAALAAASELVCLCVTGDDDVRQLLVDRGMITAMRKRSLLAIHSTIRPDTCRALAQQAAARGVALLDMPVSGSGHAALARTLLVMAGGEAAAIARTMPVLESYAGTIIRMGDVGTAMKAKLINNLMAVVNIGQAFRALSLGSRLGVDPGALRTALMAGTGRTFAIDLIERLQVPDRADHVRAILVKDVDLAIAAMPAAERDYWHPLARTGLAALATLIAGESIPLRQRKDSHGGHVACGTA